MKLIVMREGGKEMGAARRWYHSGVGYDDGGVWWSGRIHLSLEAAKRAALCLGRRHGGWGVVESWERTAGRQAGATRLEWVGPGAPPEARADVGQVW